MVLLLQPPDEDEEVDEAFYRQLVGALKLQPGLVQRKLAEGIARAHCSVFDKSWGTGEEPED